MFDSMNPLYVSVYRSRKVCKLIVAAGEQEIEQEEVRYDLHPQTF